jgi:hypothetical protein
VLPIKDSIDCERIIRGSSKLGSNIRAAKKIRPS